MTPSPKAGWTKEGTAPLDVDALERLEAMLPAGPWELWTSCSFRRITGPDGQDGGVLSAYNQRSDGHPDLSMREEHLAALVELRNALPALIANTRALAEVERKLGVAVHYLRGVKDVPFPGAPNAGELAVAIAVAALSAIQGEPDAG